MAIQKSADIIQYIACLSEIMHPWVLIFFTFILAYYTRYLYQEAKNTRQIQESQASPDICVTLERLGSKICLLVINQGRASAKNIKIIANPIFYITKKYDDGSTEKKCINEISIMNLSFLRVDQFFITDLCTYSELIDKIGNSTNIEFTILYEKEININCSKRKQKIITINIEEMKDGIDNIAVNNEKFAEYIITYATSLPIKHILAVQKNKPDDTIR
jgi:hypothetical protein